MPDIEKFKWNFQFEYKPEDSFIMPIVRDITLTENCDYCSQNIDIESELFYTIGKEPTREDKIVRKHRPKILFFHPKCFREIAGDQYL